MPSLQTRIDYALGQANANLGAVTEDVVVLTADVGTLTDSVSSVALTNAISASYTSPSSILSASDAGSDVTVAFTVHDRIYDDQSNITITAASLTGLSYSTAYAFYYDDATRAVTTPTVVATTTLVEARNNYVVGRHYLGQLTTPAAAAGPVGGGTVPPGGGDIP
jgi:hypothetical protein